MSRIFCDVDGNIRGWVPLFFLNPILAVVWFALALWGMNTLMTDAPMIPLYRMGEIVHVRISGEAGQVRSVVCPRSKGCRYGLLLRAPLFYTDTHILGRDGPITGTSYTNVYFSEDELTP